MIKYHAIALSVLVCPAYSFNERQRLQANQFVAVHNIQPAPRIDLDDHKEDNAAHDAPINPASVRYLATAQVIQRCKRTKLQPGGNQLPREAQQKRVRAKRNS
jgi:hypothetical protein